MHGDDNFVSYGSESQVVWQSFDHPIDILLGGQKLKDVVELVSSLSLFNHGYGSYDISIRQSDGLVAIYYESTQVRLISDGFGNSINSPVILKLDNTGKLYLVGSDDVVLRYLYPNNNQQHQEYDDEDYIYRAILESGGDFVLYKERFDGNVELNENSSSSVLAPSDEDSSVWVQFNMYAPVSI
ncbi:EP1-like glycoprotein 1 [Papaver somniferum]|uniref:EP1-like glycoprotein 1 n=1 Tax=Papaver somniferum TaxID=3469 RepID=UPI000E6FF3C8|nr:EP1-like glycoprotein 1 [Papaver somniferum]